MKIREEEILRCVLLFAEIYQQFHSQRSEKREIWGGDAKTWQKSVLLEVSCGRNWPLLRNDDGPTVPTVATPKFWQRCAEFFFAAWQCWLYLSSSNKDTVVQIGGENIAAGLILAQLAMRQSCMWKIIWGSSNISFWGLQCNFDSR